MYGKQQLLSCFWLPQGQVDSGFKVFAGGIFDLFSVCCAAIFARACLLIPEAGLSLRCYFSSF
jgi:hypothetical protein